MRSALEPVAIEALLLAFDRYAPRDTVDLIRAATERERTHDKRVKLYPTVSLVDFQRALSSLGADLTDAETGALVARLKLTVTGPSMSPAESPPRRSRASVSPPRGPTVTAESRIRFRDFVRFIALPMDGSDVMTAAGKTMIDDAWRMAHTQQVTHEDGVESLAVAQSPAQAPAVTSGSPRRPRTASAASGHPTPVAVQYPTASGAGGVGAVASNPWLAAYASEVAGAQLRAHRPRFAVGWPANLGNAHSAFWVAVNGLEAAVTAEVRRRATVHSVAAEPTPTFSPAMRYGASAASGTESGTFVLRRAFAFFDRRHVKAFTLEDLHATLAELRLVDPPAREYAAVSAASAVVGVDDDTVERDGSALIPVTHVSVTTAAGAGDGGSAAAATEVSLAFAARRLCAAVFRRIHGEGDVGLAIGVQPAKAGAARSAADGGGGGKRGHGERGSTPPPPPTATARAGAAAAAAQLSDADAVVRKAVTYNAFARWAAPLNSRLRLVRDKLELLFRSAATLGGGAKDFARAFRLLSARHGTGSSMTAADIRTLLGHLGRTMTTAELQVLVDFYDENGNGTVDLSEIFRASVYGFDMKAVLAAEAASGESDSYGEFRGCSRGGDGGGGGTSAGAAAEASAAVVGGEGAAVGDGAHS